jgi:ornithine lipid ester-linked acyl 2-hydroxylase
MEIKIKFFLFLVISFILFYRKYNIPILNQNFYDYKKLYPFLETLKENRQLILDEVEHLENFVDYPERDLYIPKTWTIFPYFGFGVTIDNNIRQSPKIYNLIKSIPGVKTALLSRMVPNSKLNPHQGWAFFSNKILRVHYVIKANKESYMIVNNERKKQNDNDIIIFDDAKMHYAENNGDTDKLVLILDFKRPFYVKKGQSKFTDFGEIQDFLSNIN